MLVAAEGVRHAALAQDHGVMLPARAVDRFRALILQLFDHRGIPAVDGVAEPELPVLVSTPTSERRGGVERRQKRS